MPLRFCTFARKTWKPFTLPSLREPKRRFFASLDFFAAQLNLCTGKLVQDIPLQLLIFSKLRSSVINRTLSQDDKPPLRLCSNPTFYLNAVTQDFSRQSHRSTQPATHAQSHRSLLWR